MSARIVPDVLSVTLTFGGTTDHDITSTVVSGDIQRGRTRDFAEIGAGTAELVVENDTRDFDPPGFGSSGSYGDIERGQLVVVEFDSTPVFTGNGADWNHDWPVGDIPTASLTAHDALERLGRQPAMAAWNPVAQRAGARLTAVLARPEVAWTGTTGFDAGCLKLGPIPVTAGTGAVDYCQLVARSDGGRFFASRTNELTYRQVNYGTASSVAATFRDDETEIPFYGIAVRFGSEEWYTEVIGQRVGGARLSVVADSSITDLHGGGTIPLELTGLLTSHDAAVYNLIQYLLSIYQNPDASISGLTVDMMDLTAPQGVIVAALEPGSRIQVVWTPAAEGDPVTQTLAVEGIRDRFDRANWMRYLSLSPAIGLQSWVIGNNPLGTIGTGVLGI